MTAKQSVLREINDLLQWSRPMGGRMATGAQTACDRTPDGRNGAGR